MSSVADLNELGDLDCQAFQRLSRGGETPERKPEPPSVGREGEAPGRGSRGRSPRAWVERAKPPSVGEAPERGSKGRSPRAWVERANPPSVGREGEVPERGLRGRSPRVCVYTNVDSSNEELEFYYLVPKAQYWVRTAADA
jgi:hypothetical protein